jgi:type II secretory pathway pseudopilin PulG
VVIAIIGILSGIVIASLNTARGKGKDAAVKGQLKQLQTQAELYYDTAGSHPTAGAGTYSTAGTAASSTGVACLAGTGIANSMFSNPSIATQIAIISANDAPNSTTACSTNSTGQNWAVSITGLNSSTGGYCIDNQGTSVGGTCN